MKSLVVDDHALVREGLKQVLRRIDPDMEIDETKNAAEAMEVIDQRAEPDLVLLDLMLPDESGSARGVARFRRIASPAELGPISVVISVNQLAGNPGSGAMPECGRSGLWDNQLPPLSSRKVTRCL